MNPAREIAERVHRRIWNNGACESVQCRTCTAIYEAVEAGFRAGWQAGVDDTDRDGEPLSTAEDCYAHWVKAAELVQHK
jgi:hypothetical protein